jgi:hypothetical protein
MTAGEANVVPAGPRRKTVPSAPAPGDVVGVTVIETLLGSAPLGIVSLSEPSLEEAVPPVVPITVEVGAPGGFCEEPPEHLTTARTTKAPPARRMQTEEEKEDESSFIPQS